MVEGVSETDSLAPVQPVCAVEKKGTTDWNRHRSAAVRAFLRTAVVIDNEPTFSAAGPGPSPAVATPKHDGLPLRIEPIDLARTADEEGLEDNSLPVGDLSDAFADAGIACSCIFPTMRQDNEIVLSRSRKVMASSDIVISDWYLREESDPALAKAIIRKIGEDDADQGGRLRLICVYTGHDDIHGVLADAKAVLEEIGYVFSVPIAVGNIVRCGSTNLVLVAVNKGSVAPGDLPGVLIEQFASLADGILPAFAFASIGAIRDKSHNMLARFSSSLDPAYVANRMISDPPEDVQELLLELFTSECNSIIEHSSIGDRYLGTAVIKEWMTEKSMPLGAESYSFVEYTEAGSAAKEINIEGAFLSALLEFGVSGDMAINALDGSDVQFPRQERIKIIRALVGASATPSEVEGEFAKFVTLKRESLGKRAVIRSDGWVPVLTTGTVLGLKAGKPINNSRFFMCLTPSCDLVRIDAKRRFVFAGNVEGGGKADLLITTSRETLLHLYFNKKYPNLNSLEFTPNIDTKRVQATLVENDFVFKTVQGEEFVWLGEIRYGRVASHVSEMMSRLSRLGINDSEYLRLAGIFPNAFKGASKTIPKPE